MAHRHKDSRAKWTTTDAEPPIPAAAFTAADVTKLLAIARGTSGGGTTPEPPNPPPSPPLPPVISNVVISNVTTTGATITWTTDVASTGVVVYGTGTGYGSTTAATASGTSHSRTLSGLTSGTTYHFQVRATASGLTSASSDRTFTTQQVPAPPPGTSITVGSISALKAALANNVYTEIILEDGTYHVSTAATQAADSLWIGSAYASRTNPVTIRAETTGGVTFDGTGSGTGGLISFEDGAHHQTWQGFKFANIDPTGTACIVFGGYPGLRVPCHHITLNDITVMASVTPPAGTLRGHAVYFSWSASPGGHDIIIDGLTVDNPSKRLMSAVHLYHGPSVGNDGPNYSDVIVRNTTINGTDQGFLIWEATVDNLLVEDATITGAARFGVRYEFGTNIVLRRVTTTSSGTQGFFSSLGPTPANVTFDDCSFDA